MILLYFLCFAVFAESVGDVSVLLNTPIVLYWHSTAHTHECRFSFSRKIGDKTGDEHFLHYSDQSGLVVLKPYMYGKNWTLTSDDNKCYDGIRKEYAAMNDTGQYRTSIFLKNGNMLNSDYVTVEVLTCTFGVLQDNKPLHLKIVD